MGAISGSSSCASSAVYDCPTHTALPLNSCPAAIASAAIGKHDAASGLGWYRGCNVCVLAGVPTKPDPVLDNLLRNVRSKHVRRQFFTHARAEYTETKDVKILVSLSGCYLLYDNAVIMAPDTLQQPPGIANIHHILVHPACHFHAIVEASECCKFAVGQPQTALRPSFTWKC